VLSCPDEKMVDDLDMKLVCRGIFYLCAKYAAGYVILSLNDGVKKPVIPPITAITAYFLVGASSVFLTELDLVIMSNSRPGRWNCFSITQPLP
jgi:hypothetical protein